jgi:hypothetical protein
MVPVHPRADTCMSQDIIYLLRKEIDMTSESVSDCLIGDSFKIKRPERFGTGTD